MAAFSAEENAEHLDSSEADEEARGSSEGQQEAESEEIDDETLARRLFISEQLAHSRRLMAIAGAAPTGSLLLPASEGGVDRLFEKHSLTQDSLSQRQIVGACFASAGLGRYPYALDAVWQSQKVKGHQQRIQSPGTISLIEGKPALAGLRQGDGLAEDGEFEEEELSDDGDGNYMTDDSYDPDHMTYEVKFVPLQQYRITQL